MWGKLQNTDGRGGGLGRKNVTAVTLARGPGKTLRRLSKLFPRILASPPRGQPLKEQKKGRQQTHTGMGCLGLEAGMLAGAWYRSPIGQMAGCHSQLCRGPGGLSLPLHQGF